MARSRVADRGRPGTWKKYYDGAFSEEGLGGMDQQVVPIPFDRSEAFLPSVQYVTDWEQYLMVCSVLAHWEYNSAEQPKKSGFYIYRSNDGIHWTDPQLLFPTQLFFIVGKSVRLYVGLHVIDSTSDTISGVLTYAFSPNWGTTPPHQTHHLAKRAIRLKQRHHVVVSEPGKSSPHTTSSTGDNSGERDAIHPALEQTLIGDYRLELKNVKTGKTAQQSMELRANKTLVMDSGITGRWSVKDNGLVVDIPGLEIKPDPKSNNGTYSGLVIGQARVLRNVANRKDKPTDKIRVRFKLTKTE